MAAERKEHMEHRPRTGKQDAESGPRPGRTVQLPNNNLYRIDWFVGQQNKGSTSNQPGMAASQDELKKQATLGQWNL